MSSSPAQHARPTNIRWVILFLVFVISFVAYVHRLNFNVAGKFMIDDLGYSKAQLGWMISAFIAGYTIFQVPGGMAGERFGSRRVLTWIVVLWGVFTLLSGLLPGLVFGGVTLSLISLLLARSLMGLFQAPVFPVMAGAVERWFPVAGWALPAALSSSGLTLGAMATSPLVAWLAVTYGWRASMYMTVPFTLAIAAVWWWYARDDPAEHSGVNDAELRLVQAGKDTREEEGGKRVWLKVLANREVLLLTASYFCANYAFCFFFSWFFIYLIEDRGFTALGGGFAAAVPWLVAAFLAAIGGGFCDWACKRWGPRWGCRGPSAVALAVAAAALLIGAVVDDAYVALVLFSLALGFEQFTEGAYWSGMTFVAGRHTATATGILNTGGNVVGVLSTQMFVLLEDQFGAMVAVASGAVFALLAAVLWLLIRVDHPLRIDEGV
jgi:ACS family glucarate transporter-like MFS transporter